MKALKVILWTIGLSLICVLFYIAHVNRERAVKGRYIDERIRIGMTPAELEKIIGEKMILAPEPGGRAYCWIERHPGGIYHSGYYFLFEFDANKKVDYFQSELTPMWGDTVITSSSLK